MRTTLSIDDDVLSAAKEMAAAQDKTVGEVHLLPCQARIDSNRISASVRNGVPLLPVRAGAKRVTSELVHQLRDELR